MNKKVEPQTTTPPTILEWLGTNIVYDPMGQNLFAVRDDGHHQLIIEVRGWGAIWHLFTDQVQAGEFHDSIGEFIRDAILEKVSRSQNNGIPDELISKDIARKLLIIRDALIRNDYENAWHWLYGIASPGFDEFEPWEKLEEIAGTLTCSGCNCEVPAYFIEPDDTRCHLCDLPELERKAPASTYHSIAIDRDYWKSRCEASEKMMELDDEKNAAVSKRDYARTEIFQTEGNAAWARWQELKDKRES